MEEGEERMNAIDATRLDTTTPLALRHPTSKHPMQTLYDFVTTYQQSPFKYLISDVPKDNKRSGSSSGMKRQPGEVQSYDSLSKVRSSRFLLVILSLTSFFVQIGSLSTTFSFKYLSSLGVGEHLLTRLPIKSIKSAPPEILSAFTPPSSPPKVQPQAILKLSKLVGAGDVGTVFGAVLGDGSEIVLKYSISDKVIEDVEFEAELYAHLSTTPLATKLARSFGLWSGGYDDDGVVLILENVGEPLKDEIQDYPESERCVCFVVTSMDTLRSLANFRYIPSQCPSQSKALRDC